MRVSTLAQREGEALLKRSKPWWGGHSALPSHGWRHFSVSFHFSKDVQTKISATYVEVKVCCIRLVLMKMFLQLMNQLTCSIKGKTGNQFGTCKHKKGHGVKREENVYYWALSGEAKAFTPFHRDMAHCPRVPLSIPFRQTMCCSRD